jgi:hypothetical protein
VPPAYTNAGFVFAGTNPSCGSTSGKTFVFLNATDYATFVADGNIFSTGLRFFRDLSGTTWDTSTKPKGYDGGTTTIWNCNSTGITVDTLC